MNMEEALEKFLKGFKLEIENFVENCKVCQEKDHEIMESLIKDYEDFMNWAFGNYEKTITFEESKKLWSKNHPDLPIPRCFLINQPGEEKEMSMFLIMDAYSYYLEEKS